MSSSPRQVDMSEALSPTESPATVTFEQLSTLFVPGTVVVQDCHITGQKRAYCLVGALPADHQVSSREYHEGFLRFRHVEYLDMMPRKSDSPAGSSSHYLSGDCRISKTSASLLFQVEKFNGVRSIQNLPIYPIQYHPDGKLERGLIARGKKWAGLCGRMQLVKYTGRVWRMTFKFYPVPTIPVVDELSQVEEANVFLDNEAFFIMNPHAWVFLGGNINAKEHMDTQDEECNDAIDKGLPESLLLLAPTVVHGYSLESRQWLIYDVNGTFKEVSIKNSEAAVASRLQRPTSLSKVIETHLRINAISQHVRGEDGQGLFLNLYGFTASTKAEDIARLYIDAGGVRRPQHTFYASQLSAGSSDLESFRKVINSTNAVVTVHQDKRRLFILFDWFVSGNFRATLPEQVMSAYVTTSSSCVVTMTER
ncbi:hypothetical protein L226DRAFT_570103 [Lentinus tigrinus ALCF2SS1-7]|uniref:uncharacterized protein n=1 Tax=Lentinus tigrinus ALCF2SS1-7 TaxID=1328758 RepID=UPI001165EABF|nr:hypothetical protein L226DRAFT_570103 [Lentinus tigrinus ALCF2SS1-7]